MAEKIRTRLLAAINGGGILLVLSAAAIYARTSKSPSDEPAKAEAWTARVESIKLAGKGKEGGLEQCQPDGS